MNDSSSVLPHVVKPLFEQEGLILTCVSQETSVSNVNNVTNTHRLLQAMQHVYATKKIRALIIISRKSLKLMNVPVPTLSVPFCAMYGHGTLLQSSASPDVVKDFLANKPNTTNTTMNTMSTRTAVELYKLFNELYGKQSAQRRKIAFLCVGNEKMTANHRKQLSGFKRLLRMIKEKRKQQWASVELEQLPPSLQQLRNKVHGNVHGNVFLVIMDIIQMIPRFDRVVHSPQELQQLGYHLKSFTFS